MSLGEYLECKYTCAFQVVTVSGEQKSPDVELEQQDLVDVGMVHEGVSLHHLGSNQEAEPTTGQSDMVSTQ